MSGGVKYNNRGRFTALKIIKISKSNTIPLSKVIKYAL